MELSNHRVATLLGCACALVLSACADFPVNGLTCPDFGCGSDAECLQGFVCSHGACAIPVSCGEVSGCPQDGYPSDWNACLWTGCECYANDRQGGTPPPTTCVCTSDVQAEAQGWAACDESSDTCTDTAQPPDSCVAASTCTTAAPTCPAGDVPAIRDACYTGTCRAIADCDTPPPCPALGTEGDCTTRADCEPSYSGSGCTDSDGGACVAGDTGCTCTTFEFSSCRAR